MLESFVGRVFTVEVSSEVGVDERRYIWEHLSRWARRVGTARFFLYAHPEGEAWYHLTRLPLSCHQIEEHLLPPDWSWELAAKEGKIVRRLSKLIYQKFGLSLPRDVLHELGTEVSRCGPGRRTYFTKLSPPPFAWSPGDFGDKNSCLWTAGKTTLEILEKCGRAYALLIYRDPEAECGIGRAFVLECEEGALVFNAYGVTLRTSSSILSSVLGLSSKGSPIQVVCQGDAEALFINGRLGVLVHDGSWRGNEFLLDLGSTWEFFVCHGCDCLVPREHLVLGIRGEHLCDSCFWLRYSTCDECGEVFPVLEIVDYECRYLCESCALEIVAS